MYAVVRDRSRCLTLRPGDDLLVDRLPDAEAGSTHTFDQVQLIKREDGSVAVGAPTLDGAAVVAEVVGDEKGEKIYIEKFHRRQGYRRRTGHRQPYTRIRITEIRG